ncbi:MAG: TetR/AcrR family transcriptional regulator [Omnitrophica WOR_2 bacterium]
MSTEQKIKEAARKVFSLKGYAATRTRDIADEAGINLALVNYYFRSKEKLFNEIMQEKIYQLFGTIVPILINPNLSFETKIEIVAENYIDMLIENPDLPLMVMSEVKKDIEGFGIKIQLSPLLKDSSFIRQIKDRNPNVDPVQFLLSILGMIIFPFIAKPVFISLSGMEKEQFITLMKERKKYIPIWVNAILNT